MERFTKEFRTFDDINTDESTFLNCDDTDQLIRTSDVIYEKYRQKRLEGSTRVILVFCISCLLSIAAIISICVLQYDEYIALLNDRIDYIANTAKFCNSIELSSIDIISTPIAGALLLLYIIIYRRRVFLRNKFKYRNIGLPMVVSCWDKTDRFYSAITYAIIALNVFEIAKNAFFGEANSKKIIKVADPTGLLKLLFRVAEMFLVGIRYYPVLVAFRNNQFLINFTSCVYMWIDFVENIFQYGKCQSISTDVGTEKSELKRGLPFYIVYKIFTTIPLSVFMSFITISLTYRSILNLIDYILRKKSFLTREKILKQSEDSLFCPLCSPYDEHEVFYTRYDLDYVLDLFERNSIPKQMTSNKSDLGHLTEEGRKSMNKKFKYCKIAKIKENKLTKLRDKIYKPDPYFRFTSRYINSIAVSVVALYYFVVYFGYSLIMLVTFLTSVLRSYKDLASDLVNLLTTSPTIKVQDICDTISDELPFCTDALIDTELALPKIPNGLNATLNRILQVDIAASLEAIIIVPIVFAYIICIIQLLLFIRESRLHITQMHKGECEFVVQAKNLSNGSIASSSFHFGGYLVGYQIWGYVIMYFVLVLVGVAILLLRLFGGTAVFGQILLKIVPVICVLIVKQIVNKLASQIIFLNRKSSILALDNFRAYNIFLYFNFYFDCFMGIISAIIRLIKSVIFAILMMPRLSYSFLGRHFERMDNAYACYSGFLHMESMHTNPILISFCSILYYKNLRNHIEKYKLERKLILSRINISDEYDFRIKKFIGKLVPTGVSDSKILKKKYNKHIVNKWHVIFMLHSNKSLIKYRAHNIKKIEKETGPSIVQKVVACAKKCACCKKKE